MSQWYTNDPRHVIGKRAHIIVYVSSANGGDAFISRVETKNAYWIDVSGLGSNAYEYIYENMSWPEGWLWTWCPNAKDAVEAEDSY